MKKTENSELIKVHNRSGLFNLYESGSVKMETNSFVVTCDYFVTLLGWQKMYRPSKLQFKNIKKRNPKMFLNLATEFGQ